MTHVYMRSDLTNVMGVISYICCILMVLYATMSVYRVSYFINAIFMTIAIPSLLITFTGLGGVGGGAKKEFTIKEKDDKETVKDKDE